MMIQTKVHLVGPHDSLEPQGEGPEGEIASKESSSQPPKEDINNNDRPPFPKGRSLTHHLIDDKLLCLLSLDIEHRDEHSSLLQLSAGGCKVCIIPKTNGSTLWNLCGQFINQGWIF